MRPPRTRQAYRYTQRPAAALVSAEGAAEDGCRMVAVPAVPAPDLAAGCAAGRRASVQREATLPVLLAARPGAQGPGAKEGWKTSGHIQVS